MRERAKKGKRNNKIQAGHYANQIIMPGQVFNIPDGPDEPKWDAETAKKKGRHPSIVGKPRAFEPSWMEEVADDTPVDKNKEGAQVSEAEANATDKKEKPEPKTPKAPKAPKEPKAPK